MPFFFKKKKWYLYLDHVFAKCFMFTWFLAERDGVATTASPASSLDGSTKSGRSGEGGRGGRKKYLPILNMLIIFSM